MKLGAIPKPWEIFLSRHRQWQLGELEDYLFVVCASGYPYYEWRGLIYGSGEHPRGRQNFVCGIGVIWPELGQKDRDAELASTGIDRNELFDVRETT